MADYDLIIIGSGPAGMTAAIYGARANLSVLMLDRLAPGGKIINTSEIQNYTGMGTVEGADLAIRMFQHTQELNVEFDYRTVLKVQDKGKEKLVVCQEEDKTYTAYGVILSTGTSPRMLEAAGEERRCDCGNAVPATKYSEVLPAEASGDGGRPHLPAVREGCYAEQRQEGKKVLFR